MQLILRDGLPFVSLTVAYQGRQVEIADVLVDTGSASTLLAADAVAQIGIVPEPADVLYTVRGVGGTEAVFSRRVERLQIGPRAVEQFEIEVGGMDYGFALNGILGMDILLATGALLDLHKLEVDFSAEGD
jgi:predicted aspartyl protease